MRIRRIGALLTVGLVSASIGIALTPALAQPAKDPSALLPTTDEGLEDLDLKISPTLMEERARRIVGNRFGALWLERDPDGQRYVVAIINPTDRDASQLRKATVETSRLRVVGAQRSLDVARNAMDAVGAYVRNRFTTSAVGLDALNQQIVVTVESLADVNDADHAMLRSLDPDGSTIRMAEGLTIGVQHATLTSWPPYEAALQIAVENSGCTSGFTFQNGYGWFGSTAGHCGVVGNRVFHGTTQVDVIRDNPFQSTNPTQADVAVYSISRANTTDDFYRGTNSHRDVSGKYADVNFSGGLRICTRGSYTNSQTCGDLNGQFLDGQFTYNGRTVLNQFCWTTLGTRGGDSGAPHYRVQSDGSIRAAGIANVIANFGSGDVSCFSSIQGAEAALNSTLLTTQP